MNEPAARPLTEPATQAHPWVAVDVVLFAVAEKRLRTLLVQVKHGPHAGRWAFPGGLVEIGESLEEAARRELAEKTPVRDVYLEQLFTFGDPRRNPRLHVVSTAYFALLPGPVAAPKPEPKYADVAWVDVARLPPLAYDHREVADVALDRLRAKIEYTNVVYSLLPREFTLAELQEIYEILRGRPLDRRNFRKKALASGLLKRLPRARRGAHRPAVLYAFRNRSLETAKLL